MYGNIMPQQTSIKAIDGSDIRDFWDKYKGGPAKPKQKEEQKSK
jgi:hypothetical protein